MYDESGYTMTLGTSFYDVRAKYVWRLFCPPFVCHPREHFVQVHAHTTKIGYAAGILRNGDMRILKTWYLLSKRDECIVLPKIFCFHIRHMSRYRGICHDALLIVLLLFRQFVQKFYTLTNKQNENLKKKHNNNVFVFRKGE